MSTRSLVSAVAGLAFAGTAAFTPANAAPLGHPLSFGNATSGHVEDVRWRGGGGHWGGRGHWGGGPRHFYGGYRYGNRGWGAAPFIGGLAAGALIGGAIAQGTRSPAYGAPAYGYGNAPIYQGQTYYPAQRGAYPARGGYYPAAGGYYEEPEYVQQCFRERRPVMDRWGNVVGFRRVQVCR